jgi:hypothetical protein
VSEPLEGEVVGRGPAAQQGGDGSGVPGGTGANSAAAAEVVDRWRRKWLLPVIFGAAGVVLGVLVLVWPGHTVKALTVLFGVYLLITGGYRFVAALQLKGVDAVARVVALVLAVLSVGFGLVCLARPFNAAASLARDDRRVLRHGRRPADPGVPRRQPGRARLDPRLLADLLRRHRAGRRPGRAQAA